MKKIDFTEEPWPTVGTWISWIVFGMLTLGFFLGLALGAALWRTGS